MQAASGTRETQLDLLSETKAGAAVPALQILHTEYSRGAVVKLAQDSLHPAVAKYVIERHRGQFRVLNCTHRSPIHVHDAHTLEEATGYAIRECERIRMQLAGDLRVGDL